MKFKISLLFISYMAGVLLLAWLSVKWENVTIENADSLRDSLTTVRAESSDARARDSLDTVRAWYRWRWDSLRTIVKERSGKNLYMGKVRRR
jgi:hypothetical protein